MILVSPLSFWLLYRRRLILHNIIHLIKTSIYQNGNFLKDVNTIVLVKRFIFIIALETLSKVRFYSRSILPAKP